MVTEIEEKAAAVRERIAAAARSAGRLPQSIRLMGVTKYHPAELVAQAAPFIDLIGENKVQEASAKKELLADGCGLPWHLIGHLQRNKARRALSSFDLIESLDSKELAETLERILAEENRKKFPVLLEVNISGEEAKTGAAPENLPALLEAIQKECPRLSPEGLMTVASDTENETELRRQFSRLRLLSEKLRLTSGLALPELSMGMSGDFEAAIKEGATIVRVGSAIFGPRLYK